jgi:hypothetical protein
MSRMPPVSRDALSPEDQTIWDPFGHQGTVRTARYFTRQRLPSCAKAVEAVRANATLPGLTAREGLLVEIVRSLLRTRGLSDELFSLGQAELGHQQLVETVALTG